MSSLAHSTSAESPAVAQLTARVETVKDVLGSMALEIPDYQRPYTWSTSNVDQLIGDIRRFSEAQQYRIGTFILHPATSGEEGSTLGSSPGQLLNIVDGQQRYLSFALIAHALHTRAAEIDEQLRKELEDCLDGISVPHRRDGRSERNLRANHRHLVQLVARWNAEELKSVAEFFLRSCTVVVLTVHDLDAAFQMFDSQNTRGRALFPTDLLKAYHLREFSRADPSRETVLETVRAWESIPPEEINHVISSVLFPIKHWSINAAVPDKGFTAQDVDLFKGIREVADGNGRFRWARPILLAKSAADRFEQENRTLLRHGVMEEIEFPFQITQPVIDGEMFFRMVRHYVLEARRAGIEPPLPDQEKQRSDQVDPALQGTLEILAGVPHGTGNRYIRELFDCLLIAYVDRFGWHEVDAASFILAQHAYLLRVHLQRVQFRSVDLHARNGHQRVPGADGNLFAEMSRALDPRLILSRPDAEVDADTWIPPELRALYTQTTRSSDRQEN